MHHESLHREKVTVVEHNRPDIHLRANFTGTYQGASRHGTYHCVTERDENIKAILQAIIIIPSTKKVICQ